MGFPIRMNLMRIVIEQLDLAATSKDADFREPVGRKIRPARRVLMGQANLAANKSVRPWDSTLTGDREPTKGRLVFKKTYLKAQGVALKKGDRIIEFGPESDPTPMNIVLDQVRPESPLRGDFLLIVAEFTYNRDARESVQRGTREVMR